MQGVVQVISARHIRCDWQCRKGCGRITVAGIHMLMGSFDGNVKFHRSNRRGKRKGEEDSEK